MCEKLPGFGRVGFECVFVSGKKKSAFVFVTFINYERMGNRSMFLFSSEPPNKCITMLFRAD